MGPSLCLIAFQGVSKAGMRHRVDARFTCTGEVRQTASMKPRILMGLAFWLSSTVIADTVSAQEIAWSPEATESCLTDAVDLPARRACIGRSTALCIDTPDGYTTVGMSFCASQESEYWDTRLNEAYRALSAIEAERDAEMADLGSAAPSMSDALRDMQRAWIAYRDGTCAYEASQWGGGSGTGPAVAHCRMQMTGEQALQLEQRLAQKSAQ